MQDARARLIQAAKVLDLLDSLQALFTKRPKTRQEALTYLADWKNEKLKPRYHQLARLHHPDLGGEEEKMKEISEAYNTLTKLDIVKRPPIVNIPKFIKIYFTSTRLNGQKSSTTS